MTAQRSSYGGRRSRRRPRPAMRPPRARARFFSPFAAPRRTARRGAAPDRSRPFPSRPRDPPASPPRAFAHPSSPPPGPRAPPRELCESRTPDATRETPPPSRASVRSAVRSAPRRRHGSSVRAARRGTTRSAPPGPSRRREGRGLFASVVVRVRSRSPAPPSGDPRPSVDGATVGSRAQRSRPGIRRRAGTGRGAAWRTFSGEQADVASPRRPIADRTGRPRGRAKPVNFVRVFAFEFER